MPTPPSDLLHTDQQRVQLHTPEFTADPHQAYRQMRERFGSLVPVELAPGVPATLVIGYRTALAILNDLDRFPTDPRKWETSVAADCPVLPAMQWRPSASRSTGHAHTRLRAVVSAALAEVDPHAVNAIVKRIAAPLINTFCTTGTAELVTQYSTPIAFAVINDLLGCPPAISAKAAAGVAAIYDGSDAQEGNRAFEQSLLELIRFKRATPGADITTGLLRHGGTLDEDELLQQLVLFYGIGMEPVQALVTAALFRLITNDRIGMLSTRDALDDVLFEDPPMANISFSYPRQPIMIDGVWLPAHQPVVVSIAGCNSDPEIAGGDRTGNRAHLAWGTGPHACPARSLGYTIAQCAVDELLDALPELELALPADELQWRPGPMQRALAALPVTFQPSPPLPVP